MYRHAWRFFWTCTCGPAFFFDKTFSGGNKVFRFGNYEGWNFNFGNAAITFDTAHLQSSYFHRPSMYSPTLCWTRSQRWGIRMMPLAAPVLLMVRTERPTASIMSGIVLKRLPRSGSFTLGIKSKSQGLMSREYGGWYSTTHCHLAALV